MLHSRIDRVSGLIKQELGEIIDQRLQNPLVPDFVTVHTVKVAKDLSFADVYVTFLSVEEPEAIEAATRELQKAAGFLRAELGRRIQIKYLPQLRFHYTDATRYAARIEQILQKIDLPKPE